MDKKEKVRNHSRIWVYALLTVVLCAGLIRTSCVRTPEGTGSDQPNAVSNSMNSASELAFNPMVYPSSVPGNESKFEAIAAEQERLFAEAYPELEGWGVTTTWLHELNAPAIQNFNKLFNRNPNSYEELLDSGLLPFDTRSRFPESGRILVTRRAAAITSAEYNFGEHGRFDVPQWLWHSSRKHILEWTFKTLRLFDFPELPEDIAKVYGNPVGGDPQGYFESLDDVIAFFGEINPAFWTNPVTGEQIREVSEDEFELLGSEARGQIHVLRDEGGYIKGLTLWD